MNGTGRIPRAARLPTSWSVPPQLGGPGLGWTANQLIANRNVRTPVDFSLRKSRWLSGSPLLMPNSSRGTAAAGAAKTARQRPITATVAAIVLRIS